MSLPAPAVQRRIRRLEAAGVIRANVTAVDLTSVGRAITIEVELESKRIAVIDETKSSFVAGSEVQQRYYVTGEIDLILIVTVASMAEYGKLKRALFFDNAKVKRFRNFIAMDRPKAGLTVPV